MNLWNLIEQLGCEPYICGNIGSGTVKEMSDWVDYLTGDTLTAMGKLEKEKRNRRTMES